MKKLRKLSRRLSKNGKNLESWAIFWCEYCQQEVEMYLSAGYKYKSCGCVSNELKSLSKKGEKNPQYGKKGIESPNFGKKRSEETRQKMRDKIVSEETRQKMRENSPHLSGEDHPMYGVHRFGEDSANWQNGKSFEPYAPEFNKELKKYIKTRDLNVCQTPGCMETECLHIHHIDYDKTNNNPENLITLCNSCHSKTNGKKKRKYYTEFYQNIFIEKY